MKLKHLAITLGLVSLIGCNATPNEGEQIDYGDEVETPDVLLQDTDNKKVQYGDKSYGLAADAKERDQQSKPDLLEQGLASNQSKPPAQGRKPVTMDATPQVDKPKAKAKPQQPLTEAQRHQRDSEIEVADPLLGEVDPA